MQVGFCKGEPHIDLASLMVAGNPIAMISICSVQFSEKNWYSMFRILEIQ